MGRNKKTPPNAKVAPKEHAGRRFSSAGALGINPRLPIRTDAAQTGSLANIGLKVGLAKGIKAMTAGAAPPAAVIASMEMLCSSTTPPRNPWCRAATSVSFMDAQDVAKEPFPRAAASADIALQMSAALPV